MASTDRFDIAIVGAGAVGLAAALAFCREGYRTCLIGSQDIPRDNRTVALFQGAICFFNALGIWKNLQEVATPIEALRIIDDTGNLFHVPTVEFRASELGLDAFGWNIPNAALLEKMAQAVAAIPKIVAIPDQVISFRQAGDRRSALLETADGRTIVTSLVVAADGRGSVLRQQAGIACRTWGYPQSAITAVISHERDHQNVSTEFHTRQGPFTLVPLEGRRSSLVWLTSPERARQLRRLDDTTLSRQVEQQARHMLGRMTIERPLGIVSMTGLSVDRYTAPRLALVGETAHVFPPLGAQGLNLGLRDVADLRDAVVEAGSPDTGSADLLRRYDRHRRMDVGSRTSCVDSLNRMLLSHYLPVDWARAAGLLAIAGVPALRRTVMRIGMRPLIGTPQLMQGTVQFEQPNHG